MVKITKKVSVEDKEKKNESSMNFQIEDIKYKDCCSVDDMRIKHQIEATEEVEKIKITGLKNKN